MRDAARNGDRGRHDGRCGRFLRARVNRFAGALKSGLELLVDIPGSGDLVRRQKNYRIRLRLWLNREKQFGGRLPGGLRISRGSRTTVKR